MSDVVTGEAVVVEVRLAQLPTRALALIIDMGIQLLTMVTVLMLVANAALITDGAMATALIVLFIVLVIVGYPVLFETLTRGRSPGKFAMGLRVVADDGGPERFRQALFRGLAEVVEIWLLTGAPALITSLISEKGKRLGDIFAGTIVISERGPRTDEPVLEIPPVLAPWAASLTFAQLPLDLAGTARQYLSRLPHLSPPVQHEMGVRIATQVMAYVSPPPPPNVPPWVYLSAVFAERRRRDHARFTGQAAPASPPGPPAPLAPPAHSMPAPPYGTAAGQAAPGVSPYGPPPGETARHDSDADSTGTTPGGFVLPS
ncbi:Uncharacterized membrane protein YckC, RDD family [Sinosporangium album]|uniref:Uncharacterized membrane protein YckC, RDD family n=1 Tax=Sinosporangium album TaxID=504805 RepID=A0A1G7VXH7_9ACTN|nr:RDD family protein [Sinosporangium album]SDG64437.1 Uncharacterized membrane protein YckC, RDD family [Sinosporangium album]